MATAKPVVRTRWTSEMEEQLVEMWQQHDCLFNVSSKLYHNRSDKEKSWGEIASLLNVPGPHTSTQQEGQDHTSLFPTPRPALKRRKADTDTVEQRKLKLLQQMSASVLASPDACSSFGNQVAVELRLIKNTSLQTRVKRKIMNALFEAQEADQSSSSSSSHMPPPIYSPLTPTQMSTSTALYTQTPQHYHQHMPPQGPVQPQMLELEE
ncbi:uncharacterized protein LOC107698613 isoform X2 [Sinocyclocheilus anshuiensis]|uniref:uncharacterized protein LOC107698613 isoform X2 n=1 Tax=Sinocyclocheilus anshuiensis TaxID=1608454 RepID=UPI0007BA7FC3|nr:PREDICTED: uncharacterized protein LOC107698613 isoform X2 [Sinocyclocheilus anshuiensis]